MFNYQENLPDYLRTLALSGLEDVLQAVAVSRSTGRDGREIHIYKLGDPASDCLILRPPIGISFLLVARLARALSQRFYVMIWESRGCPDVNGPLTDSDIELETQAADLEAILQREDIQRFHFVGWCQAAQLAVQTLCRAKATPQTLALVAPAGLGCAVLASDFEKNALPIYLQIEQNGVEYAGKLRKILDKFGDQPLTESNMAEKLSLLHLVSPEATYRFSRYMKAYKNNQQNVKALLDSALSEKHTCIIHSRDDNYSHYSESVQLSKRYPSVRLKVLPAGGHLLLFYQPQQVADIIFQFIETTP